MEFSGTLAQDIWFRISHLLDKLGLNSWEALFVIIIILAIDLVLLYRKKESKQRFLLKQEDGANEDSQRYVKYYKEKQYIQTLRGILRVIVMFSFILYHKPNIFAGLAIAVWAFVITFGSVFLSLGIYLYLISFYSPWKCVRIGEYTGEILSITPLYLKILGKNDNGEHTGELINIPNHQIWQNKISLIDLDFNAVNKIIMEIHYQYDTYKLSFEEFVSQLKDFLDETFPINTANSANHYKSFKGHRYKLDYDFDNEKRTIIRLAFLCKRSKNHEYKYKIIAFAEKLKKNAAKKQEFRHESQ